MSAASGSKAPSAKTVASKAASRPKHVPLRRCLSCRTSKPQAELVRLVKDGAGQWLLDPGRKAPGRGAWVCRDKPSCWTVRALRRSLKAQAERVAQELAGLLTRSDPEPQIQEPQIQGDAGHRRGAEQARQSAREAGREAGGEAGGARKPLRVRVKGRLEPSSERPNKPTKNDTNGGPNV